MADSVGLTHKLLNPQVARKASLIFESIEVLWLPLLIMVKTPRDVGRDVEMVKHDALSCV